MALQGLFFMNRIVGMALLGYNGLIKLELAIVSKWRYRLEYAYLHTQVLRLNPAAVVHTMHQLLTIPIRAIGSMNLKVEHLYGQ